MPVHRRLHGLGENFGSEQGTNPCMRGRAFLLLTTLAELFVSFRHVYASQETVATMLDDPDWQDLVHVLSIPAESSSTKSTPVPNLDLCGASLAVESDLWRDLLRPFEQYAVIYLAGQSNGDRKPTIPEDPFCLKACFTPEKIRSSTWVAHYCQGLQIVEAVQNITSLSIGSLSSASLGTLWACLKNFRGSSSISTSSLMIVIRR